MADVNAVLTEDGLSYLCSKIKQLVNDASLQTTPVGSVLMWSGSATEIPSGWALCDGRNGTPNLQGRFVLGSGDGHVKGETGGSSEHILTEVELPAHSHTYSGVTITESTEGGSLFSGGEDLISADGGDNRTGSTGLGKPFNIMPPYYVLAYIMRVA